MAKLTVYTKEGKKWVEARTTTDAVEVYESLSRDLINKKINQCTYITSIQRVNLYNGTQRITVRYCNGVKSEYIIKN
jgi:hypothetical protein